MTTIFMRLLYNVNCGQVHPYFILFYITGIAVSKIGVKYLKKGILKLKGRLRG